MFQRPCKGQRTLFMKEQEEKYILSLESLLEISVLLNSELDFSKVIQSAILTCLGQAAARFGAVYIKKPLSEGYELAFQKGLDEQKIPLNQIQQIQISDAVSQKAEEQTGPFAYVPGTASAMDLMNPALILPLRAKDRLTGFMALGPKYFGNYQAEDFEFFKKFSMITANAVENSLLYSLATRDTKTGLYLHHYFMGRLHEEIQSYDRYHERFSLVMMDLDHFKRVNDTYGHAAGDAVLEQAGKAILDFVRGCDLPCRFGGEEFAVILPATDESGASHFAERLRIAVEQRAFLYKGQRIPVTASFGVAEYSEKKTAEELVEQADKALYLAKEGGRNQVCSYSDYLREKE